MTSLVIEMCTEEGAIAFCRGEELLFLGEMGRGYHNAKFLLDKIKEGAGELGIELAELKSIIVSVGPGSYTGIRAGAAAASTLSFLLNIPLVGVSTLEGFLGEPPFAALIDAKMSGVYLWKGEAYEVCPLEKLGEALGEIRTLVTPHAEQLKIKIDRLFPGSRWQWHQQKPDLLALYRAGASKEPVKKLELLYLRKAQAELDRAC